MVNRGGPIIVRDVGKRFDRIDWIVEIRRLIPSAGVVKVGIRAAVAMVIHAGLPFTMFGPGLEIGGCEFIAYGDRFRDWPGQSAKERLFGTNLPTTACRFTKSREEGSDLCRAL